MIISIITICSWFFYQLQHNPHVKLYIVKTINPLCEEKRGYLIKSHRDGIGVVL